MFVIPLDNVHSTLNHLGWDHDKKVLVCEFTHSLSEREYRMIITFVLSLSRNEVKSFLLYKTENFISNLALVISILTSRS